jgi:hypothetical protein
VVKKPAVEDLGGLLVVLRLRRSSLFMPLQDGLDVFGKFGQKEVGVFDPHRRTE